MACHSSLQATLQPCCNQLEWSLLAFIWMSPWLIWPKQTRRDEASMMKLSDVGVCPLRLQQNNPNLSTLGHLGHLRFSLDTLV
jgi:hypothetical protein